MKRILAAAPFVLLAIISIVAGILVARQFTRSKPHHQSTLQGQHLAAKIDWARSDRTLVLALQVRCKYCADSIGFYRTLLPEAMNQGIPVVAVFPDDPSLVRQYLDASGLLISETRQSNLASLGITGTPTVLLVNKDGIIVKTWEGKLPQAAEQEVLTTVQGSGAK